MGKELFKNIPSKVGDLVKDVRNGRIGLPDLQRPFVWRDNKVRELFDSMLKGYPIGYIMLWESPVDYESKKSTIGDNSKTYEEPKELVIDGQQRLTALVAAMFAVKVKDKNFADREIKISYNPLTREFAVWSQAYEKDTEWISRISDVFLAKEDNSISSLRRHFIKEANEGRSKKELPLLTDEEEDRIEDNINALLNLSDYSLPTLEISYTADEEDVADIFVRVNSGGQSLTENNFIQTLISVYENETSNKINAFAAASRVPAANTSYNTLLAIEPSHLIRMAIGVGFKRARLRLSEVTGLTLDRLEQFSPDDNGIFVSNTILESFGLTTVLTTWLVRDGYGFTAPVETVDFAGYIGYYMGKHLYLINQELSNEAIAAITEKFDTDGTFNPENVVLFGYSFKWTEMEALKTNLARLKDTEKNLRINFDIRY